MYDMKEIYLNYLLTFTYITLHYIHTTLPPSPPLHFFYIFYTPWGEEGEVAIEGVEEGVAEAVMVPKSNIYKQRAPKSDTFMRISTSKAIMVEVGLTLQLTVAKALEPRNAGDRITTKPTHMASNSIPQNMAKDKTLIGKNDMKMLSLNLLLLIIIN